MSTPLSPSEVDVLLMFADGLSLAEIAEQTDRSRSTIKNHCANVHKKLGVHSTAEGIAVAIREGYLTVTSPPPPSRRNREVGATVKRESAERVDGMRGGEGVAPATLRSPMTRGREARRANLLDVLSREGLIGGDEA